MLSISRDEAKVPNCSDASLNTGYPGSAGNFAPFQVVAYVPLAARSNTRTAVDTFSARRSRDRANRAPGNADTRVTIYHVQMAFRRGRSGRWVPILKRYFLIEFTMPRSVIHRHIFHCHSGLLTQSATFLSPWKQRFKAFETFILLYNCWEIQHRK